MKASRERSYGIVPLQRSSDGGVRVLLVQHRAGHWSFPKGHALSGEEPLQAAQRELFEETGLHTVELCSQGPFVEKYHLMRGDSHVDKEVVYYPAYVEGVLVVQASELLDAVWLLPEELVSYATFPEMKRLCRDVVEWLLLNQ